MDADERAARADLCRYARLAWRRGLVAGTSGNLSRRCGDETILVTPAGVALRELAPGDLVRVSLADGRIDGGRPTSELQLHLAAYSARPQTRAVVHVHATHVIAWSKRGRLFPLDSVGAIESLGPIAYAAYAPAGSAELAACCAEAFGRGAETVVMERHGLSSLGDSTAAAFDRADLAEQTAAIETFAAVLPGR